MIYALLSRNFVVEIYALFPQNVLDWGAESANFFAFWMYALDISTYGHMTYMELRTLDKRRMELRTLNNEAHGTIKA